MADLTQARRDAIRQIVRAHQVSTQEELGELLAQRGYDVTQATLSRDLARLRARRVTLREGGTFYEIDVPVAGNDGELARMADLVVGVEESHALAVVLTRVGVAPAVAIAIDQARLSEIVGTIAGDDTIFVAPSRKTTPRALVKRLKQVWKKGDA